MEKKSRTKDVHPVKFGSGQQYRNLAVELLSDHYFRVNEGKEEKVIENKQKNRPIEFFFAYSVPRVSILMCLYVWKYCMCMSVKTTDKWCVRCTSTCFNVSIFQCSHRNSVEGFSLCYEKFFDCVRVYSFLFSFLWWMYGVVPTMAAFI